MVVASHTLLITCSKEIEVEAEIRYNLEVLATPNGSGAVTPSAGTYSAESVIELTAVPADGWEFVEWTGDYVGTDNPITITFDNSKSITANFSLTQDFFISQSPSYNYPNNTVGQIINNYYFPGVYPHTDFIADNIDLYYTENNVEYNYRMFGREGIYFDYNNDGKLDFFGFLTNFIPNWGVEKGKLYICAMFSITN